MSRDYDASTRFYSDVIGYRLQEIGEGGVRYSVASLDGERAVAGIGAIPAQAPADVPSHWMAHFAVADCDAAAERVTALGGSVMQPPFDTRYGRMALVAGPQGETFSVMQLPEQRDDRLTEGVCRWARDRARTPDRGGRHTNHSPRSGRMAAWLRSLTQPRPSRSGRSTAATAAPSRRSSTTSRRRPSTGSACTSRSSG